jgi:uncharacterized protein (DUF2141 family)
MKVGRNLQEPMRRSIPMNQRDLFIKRRLGVAVLSVALFTWMIRFRPLAAAQSTGAATLIVHVTGARNAKGQIRAALFQSAHGFPGDPSQAIRTQAESIDPQTLSTQIVFTGLPEGGYAVSVFQDENMNHKLDKNFVGIPREGYGASNNPKKKMGPPDFQETKFQLSSARQTLEIRLIY